jgi:hypothetical protein
VPGSLDKKGERRFHLSSIFCLIKDGTLFPFRCLMNPALLTVICCLMTELLGQITQKISF